MIPASGSCRKTPEIAGTWKQYSDRNTVSTKSPKSPGTGSFQAGLFDLGGTSKNHFHQEIEIVLSLLIHQMQPVSGYYCNVNTESYRPVHSI